MMPRALVFGLVLGIERERAGMPKRFREVLPPIDPRRIAVFIVLVLPLTLALNFVADGNTWGAVSSVLSIPILWAIVWLWDLVANRLTYYRWMVVRTAPLQIVMAACVVASAGGLYQLTDDGKTLKVRGWHANAGAQVLLCMCGLIAATFLLRVIYNRL
jgi:hypothetical protein